MIVPGMNDFQDGFAVAPSEDTSSGERASIASGYSTQ